MRTMNILTVFLSILIFIPFTLCLSLYSPEDPLRELDSSNFESVILQKSNAWIVEFYNNWCGHCIRYAPTWKQFSNDVRTWRKVIDVAVVNCADSYNVKLCRDYDVAGYPSIKLFKPFMNETDKGEFLDGDRDIESLETTIVKFLESYQDENAPPDWPELHALDSSDVTGITNQLKDGSLVLFFEHDDSSVGKKVIMDLSFQTTDIIRRVLMSNTDLISNLKTEVANSSLAVVIKIDKKGNEHLIERFSAGTNSTYIRDTVFMNVVGNPRSESKELLGSKTNSNHVSVRDAVHMTDLENALRYLLYQEIGVVKHIYGDRLDALKNFILVLKNYFPGRPPIVNYLSELNGWISKQKNITGEYFVRKLDQLKTEKEFLPEMKDFVGCKGSEPRYRGYPCSLWTLFHTLTVQAYITDVETAGALHDEVMMVLPNIKNYIKYFFTCEECVQNFFKMDQNIDRSTSSAENVVLWLWAAHNQVNHRLAGDITEDPQHPKIQFPSPSMCPNCRLRNEDSDEVKWDQVQVLRFLRYFYGKQTIVLADKDGSNMKHESSVTNGNSSMVISLKNVSFYENWSFQWFTSTDISLCVSLYMVSALLLVLIFLLFRQRRRRKKNQIYKYINLYP